MTSRLQKIVALITSLLSLTSYAAAPLNVDLAPMLEKILPAVVNIKADIKVTDFNTLSKLQQQRGAVDGQIPDTYLSMGSGVVVDPDKGYIITNAHVIADAQSVTVTLGDGHHYTAKIIGIDKPSDIGVLQIKAKNLSAIPISDSNSLRVGEPVAAIGNPFGLNQSVSSGIVSALGRTTLGIESFENFIQTDAPINPGNSGGALVDMQGQLIGINTAILTPERGSIGIGFAIPSNMAKSIMQQLIQFGDVKRGALGIGAQDITPDLQTALKLESTKGAAVTLVKIDSPASKAGFQTGDIIKKINSTDIKNANDVVNTIAALRVNSAVTVEVLRLNKPLVLHAQVTDPKEQKAASAATDPFFYGVGLKNFSLLSPLHGSIKGVMVISVESDSHAWQADLRPGDLINSVDQKKISDIEELKKAVSGSKDSVLLNVLRGPGAVFLVINKDPS